MLLSLLVHPLRTQVRRALLTGRLASSFGGLGVCELPPECGARRFRPQNQRNHRGISLMLERLFLANLLHPLRTHHRRSISSRSSAAFSRSASIAGDAPSWTVLPIFVASYASGMPKVIAGTSCRVRALAAEASARFRKSHQNSELAPPAVPQYGGFGILALTRARVSNVAPAPNAMGRGDASC